MSHPPNASAEQHDITFEDLGRFTVNDKGQVCLDGKPIEVQRLNLTRWQAFFGIAAAVAVVVQTVVFVWYTLPLVLK